MARTKWTNEMLQASADRYETRGEWKKGDFKAYQTAQKRGLDPFCGHMTVVHKTWTNEMLQASANKYQTRSEWQKGDQNAHQAAHRRDIDQFCGHMTAKLKTWTEEMLQASADRYQTRKEWQRGDASAYQTAQKRGTLDKVCGHMTVMYKTWTNEMLQASADRYQTRSEWRAGDHSAYATAHFRGLLDQCCGHMVSGFGGTDNDAIYIWLVAGLVFNGLPVYKIGVTSHRLGDARIQQCASRNDMMPRIVKLAQVEGIKASDIETELHSLGQTVDCIPQGADGYTEFRALTNEELKLAIDIIELAEII